MRNLLGTSVILLLLGGCVPTGSPPPGSGPSDAPSQAVAPAPPSATAPFIEITPQAREQLRAIAKAQNAKNPWWLRITIKPGGCQGMRESLDLDIAGAGPGDAEYRCGDIRCLTTATHDFLVQGVLIGWTQNEKERGFTVTFPNKTPENQKKTGKWIDDKLKAWRAANEQQAK